jgi:hypothetical protein
VLLMVRFERVRHPIEKIVLVETVQHAAARFDDASERAGNDQCMWRDREAWRRVEPSFFRNGRRLRVNDDICSTPVPAA